MPSVTKTWTFASGAEGLADAGNSAVTFAAQAGDGNPADSVKFTQGTKSVTHTEFARRATTGETWETWGVPAGATVTDVQVTAWSERLVSNTKLSSHSIKARIIDSGGASVHAAGDLLDVALGTTTDASWQAGAAGTQRAVDSAKQASTTDVRLELEYGVTTSGGGGSANVDQRFDQIELTITYSENTNRRAILTFAEVEAPNAPRRSLVTFAELEAPSAPRRAILSFGEIEAPDAPRRARVAFAELEAPDALRRALLTWAELETPDAPSPNRRALISFAEAEIPNAPRRVRLSFAEFEVPDASSPSRRALVSFAEFEVPPASRPATISSSFCSWPWESS